MFHYGVQTEDSDETCEVTDDGAIGFDVKFFDGVDGLGSGHVVGVIG